VVRIERNITAEVKELTIAISSKAVKAKKKRL
jgi:hypothetical protein